MMMAYGKDYEDCRNIEHKFLVFVLVFLDISVKRLLKQPLHNHTHLFIKAHTKSRAFFNIQAGDGGQMSPSRLPPCASHEITFYPHPQEKSLFPKFIQTNQRRITNR